MFIISFIVTAKIIYKDGPNYYTRAIYPKFIKLHQGLYIQFEMPTSYYCVRQFKTNINGVECRPVRVLYSHMMQEFWDGRHKLKKSRPRNITTTVLTVILLQNLTNSIPGNTTVCVNSLFDMYFDTSWVGQIIYLSGSVLTQCGPLHCLG